MSRDVIGALGQLGWVLIPSLGDRVYFNGAAYFGHGHGHCRDAMRHVDHFVRDRLVRHLSRRSQRPYLPPDWRKWYEHLRALGLHAPGPC
jgi:hypothetical protein